MLLTPLLLAASLSGIEVASAHAKEPYTVEIEEWRAQRLERLTSATGWLSLVGLDWLKPGVNTIGSAKDNDIIIATAPKHLGKIEWKGDEVTVALNPGSNATIDGDSVVAGILLDDSHEKPTTVAFGSTSFYLIERAGGKKGLRVKDAKAETRTGFLGLDNYPIDPSWRIEAKWIAFDPPRVMEIPNVIGTVDSMTVPGKAVFERDGQTYELLPVFETEAATELFYIIADKTTGKETYGAGRFFYYELPVDGKVVLDFNKAYNPPCAFTPFANC
ncbi:DUF1684 domain-containing protein, partial [Dokdonella sp.]|uniref:DUF1684 domain-containing protein n=1 Tax=Dokdonella sp. TaxID=2291710 RepID=UPI003C4E0732